jgi:hypothetical protein
MCLIDVALLSLLGSTCQQDDDRLTIPRKIDSIAGAEMDPEFQHAFAHAFDVREIALLYLSKRADNFGAGRGVKFSEPFGEGLLATRGDVVADIHYNKSNTCVTLVSRTKFGDFKAPAYADFRTALSTSVLPSDQIAPGTLWLEAITVSKAFSIQPQSSSVMVKGGSSLMVWLPWPETWVRIL